MAVTEIWQLVSWEAEYLPLDDPPTHFQRVTTIVMSNGLQSRTVTVSAEDTHTAFSDTNSPQSDAVAAVAAANV